MKKILTIIVPAYNMENYLYKDLRSLVITSDEFKDLEVIVVNDGSKDKTFEIANSFCNDYPDTFKVIDKRNGNYGSCVNAGLQVAQGTFVKIMDADDYFANENFAEYIHILKESEEKNENLDMILTDYYSVNESGDILKRYTKNLKTNKVFEIKKADDIKLLDNLQHHAITYRTSILKKMSYKQSEGVSYTDQEWITIPLFMVHKFKYVPIELYVYLIGRQGQTMDETIFKSSFDKHCIVLQNMMCCFNDKKDEFPDINAKIVKQKILDFMNFVYTTFLVKYRLKNEVMDFDNKLKRDYPMFYDESNNLLIGTKIRIKYLKHWRTNPDSIRFTIDERLFKLKR